MVKLAKLSPARLIVLGFAAVILLGAFLLSLPASHNPGSQVSAIDALFTSTSAVCVTGLITVETADTFSTFGQAVIATLIQIGGLGFASIGVGFILLARGKVSFKERMVIKEALNLNSLQGIVRLVKSVLLITLGFEIIGVILSYIVFSQDYSPLTALRISVFHAISSFNNAGFDILGGYQSLTMYKDNILLNLTTAGLIIFGGLGFLVIRDIVERRSFKKLRLHSKIVIATTIFLLIAGTLLIKITDDVSFLGAFFLSVSARTAGFANYQLDSFSNAGLFVLIILMFIGASPGSTGGGLKTTTTFTLMKSAYSAATNSHCNAYKRRIPEDVIHKAFIVFLLAIAILFLDTLLLSIFEPEHSFINLFFEAASALGTVGLSTGITSTLTLSSKIILMLTMFIGRVGALTVITIWSFKPISNVSYSEELITIG